MKTPDEMFEKFMHDELIPESHKWYEVISDDDRIRLSFLAGISADRAAILDMLRDKLSESDENSSINFKDSMFDGISETIKLIEGMK